MSKMSAGPRLADVQVEVHAHLFLSRDGCSDDRVTRDQGVAPKQDIRSKQKAQVIKLNLCIENASILDALTVVALAQQSLTHIKMDLKARLVDVGPREDKKHNCCRAKKH